MEVFVHHIYEYEKGLRNLVLHTASKDDLKMILNKLKNRKIDYEIYKIEGNRINIFFGSKECVNVIKKYREGITYGLHCRRRFYTGDYAGI